MLLNHDGVDVDVKDEDGWTALTSAVESGHSNVMALLLVNLAFVDERENDSWTALHVASFRGNVDAVQLLLHFGADPIIRNRLRCTPRKIAELHNRTTVIDTLDQFSPGKDFEDIRPYFEQYITTRSQLLHSIQKCQAILVDRVNEPSMVGYFTKILKCLKVMDATKIFQALKSVPSIRKSLASSGGDVSTLRKRLTEAEVPVDGRGEGSVERGRRL